MYTHSIKFEVVRNPVVGPLVLVPQPHDEQGVDAIDDCRPHGRPAEDASRMTSPGYRLELVGSPCILHVAIPRMQHHL